MTVTSIEGRPIYFNLKGLISYPLTAARVQGVRPPYHKMLMTDGPESRVVRESFGPNSTRNYIFRRNVEMTVLLHRIK